MTKEQFLSITQWQKETFPHATPLSKVCHLEEEVRELKADIQEDSIYRVSEYADCLILLFGAAAVDGMTYEEICEVINAKMQINKNRKWGKPDANGVVNHI